MSRPIFNKLFFATVYTCFGDMFVLYSIVKHYAKFAHTLYFPALPNVYATAVSLFSTIPNVEIVLITELKDLEPYNCRPDFTYLNCANAVKAFNGVAGGLNFNNVALVWDMQLYEYFDIPFSKRYTDFEYPDKTENSDELYDRLTEGEGSYILFHNTMGFPSRVLDIDLNAWRRASGFGEDEKVIYLSPQHTNNMMDYVKLIKNAKEIHCIPSAFFCLIDGMRDVNKNLFLHNARNDTVMIFNNYYNLHKWHMVDYEYKI